MKSYMNFSLLAILCITGSSCSFLDPQVIIDEWSRSTDNPILRDEYVGGGYESASDGHIFYDASGDLHMIYSGDVDGSSSIKYAKGSSLTSWEIQEPLLFETGPSNLDIHKETSFYRKTADGKHQIYYIGYPDGDTYESQIYLAEADEISGPYEQMAEPVVPRGQIAGKEVYLMTSPSVNEHEGQLFISFIGWDAPHDNVTEVYILGAVSTDEGKTWSDFKEVDTPIGMEGQVTSHPDGGFVAVRSGDFRGEKGVFYSTADHPHGPWTEEEQLILTEDGSEFEVDEIVAPQITFDPTTGRELLYYTGADYTKGWWMMLAEKME